MKRNVFAMILTLALAVAMVLVISPAAKADESVIIQAQADGAIAVEAGKILDLNGFDVTVAVDDALCVIDSKNTAKTGEGENVGTVKNTGAGVIVAVSQDPATKMRYLAVENGDGTYSAHPFNMTISQLGLNTVKEAICVRTSFMANDKVIALIEDYGISVGGVDASAKNSYPFAANMINAYADLTGSLASDAAIDTQKTAKAYVKIGGETVYSTYEANVTPREVLKTINKSDVAPTDTQLAAILELANNSHLSNLFTRFTGVACQHQGGTATCTAAAVCIDCDAAYGTSLGHSFGTNNPTCGVCGTENPDYVPPVKATITNWLVSGSFADDRVYPAGNGDGSVGPQLSIDTSATTQWSPIVNAGYSGAPGIIYKLDGWYNLTKLELNTGTKKVYFDVFGSSDGITYSKLTEVNADNAGNIYSGNIAIVAVDCEAVRYVKITFTGESDSDSTVNLYDTAIFGIAAQQPEPPATEPEESVKAPIIGHTLTGTFTKESTPANSYDGSTTSKWSPETNSNYTGEPGIIYTLAGSYDLTKLEVDCSAGNEMFFRVLGSTDGENYTELAVVSSGNMAEIYSGTKIATIPVAAENIRYVKLIFTGRNKSGQWVHINEISIMGVPVPVETVKATVSGYEFVTNGVASTDGYVNGIVGKPGNLYDGNAGTMWNPNIKNFTSGIGVTLELAESYDLAKMVISLGKNNSLLRILVSADNVDFTEIAAITTSSQYDANRQVTFDGLTAENVKYVRIEITGGSTWVTINEFEIYAIVN